jgi:hypothetical protein
MSVPSDDILPDAQANTTNEPDVLAALGIGFRPRGTISSSGLGEPERGKSG